MIRKLTPVFLSLILFSCTPNDLVDSAPDQTEAYAPVYASTVEVTKISFEAARKTEQAGKIYATRNYIFQNDINKGIHIINNSSVANPEKVGFINLPFSNEIAVKGNFLYSNNLNDLVVFDITDLSKPRLVKRIQNVFPSVNQKYPPQANVLFECPDPKKGVVISWEKKLLSAPKCRR